MPNMTRVKRAIELREEKKSLNARLKAINSELDGLDDTLISSFADEGIDNVKVDGVTLYPSARIWAGVEGERDDAIQAFMKAPPELGFRQTLTSNAQSLSKVVRDAIKQAEDADPSIKELDDADKIKRVFSAEIAPHLRIWTSYTLNARNVQAENFRESPKESRQATKGCSIPKCKGKHKAKGLCSQHYGQDYRRRAKAAA